MSEQREAASIDTPAEAAIEWVEHAHGNRTHAHAHGTVDHTHMLRAICQRPECAGAETHNIHRHRVIGDDEVLPYPPVDSGHAIAPPEQAQNGSEGGAS